MFSLFQAVVAAAVRPVAKNNGLTVFGDLPLPDHLSRSKDDIKSYARRIQLAVKGKLVDVLGVKPGDYAIVESDSAESLGNSIDVIPIAYLDKAVDTSGSDVVIAFGKDNEEYQRIAADLRADGFDSGCMVGPCFLVYERTTADFYELFCNNASMLRETQVLFDSLPVTKSQAEAHGIEPKPPQPVNLGSKYLTKGKYPRQVPVFKKSDAVFETQPEQQALLDAIKNFIAQAEVEEDDHER